jgi:small-conductance mechanosensitive channel
MEVIDSIFGTLQPFGTLDPLLQRRLLFTVAVVLLVWLLQRLVLSVVRRRTDDVRVHYRWKKSCQYSGAATVLFLLGLIWFEGFRSLATYFGLLSAGLAIALKELVANLVGWVFILWRRPFEVGDRIQIGGVAGDIIDLRIFQFTVLEIGNWVEADQSTGRIIHVNNGSVFSDHLANFTKGFQYIWNEVPVLVTFESDWRSAKALLAEIASKHAQHLSEAAQERLRMASRKFMIFYSKLTPTVYTSVRDCGVLLTIRYLCDPRQRRTSEEQIWEDILDAFASLETIDFAYPTQRFYDNLQEGKAGTKPNS